MRLKPQQSAYLARKVAIDLANAPFVKLLKGIDAVADKVKEIIDENLKQEKALDEHVKEIIEENYDEIEFQHADERQLFFMIKKKLAPEYGVIINYDDRYNDLAHKILDELYEEYLIDYQVSDNKVKNVIFQAFKEFAKIYDEVDEVVYEKIKNMKKEYIPGTPEYDAIYQIQYEAELKRRGII
jgi:hypothetical protein